MQVATLTREHHVTKRVKKVKTKSKGLSICMVGQELSTLVGLILTESVATTTGWTDAEFWARHTETDEDFFFNKSKLFHVQATKAHEQGEDSASAVRLSRFARGERHHSKRQR